MNRPTYIFLAITLVIVSILTLPRILGILAPEAPAKYSLHVVRKGDTLDGLSKKYMPQTELRAAKYFIKRANGMSDNYNIQPGDLLSVPDPDGELEEPLGDVYTTAKAAREVTLAAEREARESQQTASRGGQREMVMEATAYSMGTVTASGLPVDRGIVAADPDVLPMGTVIWVSGYGYSVVADTGRLIKGNIIDVYFKDNAAALNWGRRQVRVRVIR